MKRFNTAIIQIAARVLAGVILAESALSDDFPPTHPATSPANNSTSAPSTEAPAPQNTLTGDWLGTRTALANNGVTFDLTLTLDVSQNLRGGIDTAHNVWRNLFEAAISLDTKPLLHLDGGKVFIDFQNQSGQHGTNRLVGDVQKFDNIDADGRTEIAQLWYEQTLANGALRFKVGKVDANSEFQKSDNSGDSLMSPSAFSPTTFTLPTYPDGSTSVNVFVQPGAGFYGGFGIYDGSQIRGIEPGRLGPKTFFHDPRDLFMITEIGRRWGSEPGKLPGRLSFGGWYDTNRFLRFDGGRDSATGGSYFVFDQTVWRPTDFSPENKDDTRGIALYALGGEADKTVSLFQYHIGAGLAWNAPFPTRRRDVLSVGFNAVQFSSEAHLHSNHEVAFDCFYKFQATRWFSIKPDLQYITTPGGTHRDALVATIRLLFNF